MDVNGFLLSLLDRLSGLQYVEKVDFNSEVFVLKGRVWVGAKRYMQVYFNDISMN